jgi:hypothetical protein
MDSRAKQHPKENSWRLAGGTSKIANGRIEEREALAYKREGWHRCDRTHQRAASITAVGWKTVPLLVKVGDDAGMRSSVPHDLRCRGLTMVKLDGDRAI